MSVAKISPEQVKIGYFIQLPVNWMKHPFLSNKFKVESYEQIAIIQTLDLEFVYFFPEKSSIDGNQGPEPETADLNQLAAEMKFQLEREKIPGLNKPKSNAASCKRQKKLLSNRWYK